MQHPQINYLNQSINHLSLQQSHTPNINTQIHPNSQLNYQSKLFQVFSQAYPSLQDGQLPYQEIQLNNNQTTLNKQKKILKPQVKSQVHQKLIKINFNPQKHTQPIQIRSFQINDLKQLRKLQDQWFPIRYTKSFYQKIIHKQCYCIIAETVIKVPHNQNQAQSQQKQQTILVGAAVFEITDSQGYAYKSWSDTFMNLFQTPQDSVYIMTLGVIDQFRQKGVGKILVDKIISTAKQWNNIKLVYLHVISYNKAAINFYKKIGFSNLQSLHNFYHVGGKQFNGQVYGMFVNGGKHSSKWTQWFNKLFK